VTEPALFDVTTFLAEERLRADRALERALDRLEAEVPEELMPAIRHAVLTGGKRLRPILCAAAFRACEGPDGELAYDLGASVELIHAYSLMHDDLPCMDDAELRRGRPTPHMVFGEATAMRAGMALIPLAGLQAAWACEALGLSGEIPGAVVEELMKAAGAGGMVGGQVLDLVGEGRSLSAAELDGLHRRKTGALLTAALRIGAIAGEANPGVLEALDRYGKAVGLAFQIADDVLDATSTAEALGKNPSDAALAKSTYVSLYGLQEARARASSQSAAAVRALREAEISSPALEALAGYVVERSS
jgi:farnesyl diphosphate synthase/geranylgeranyl diphosphate synthase type II